MVNISNITISIVNELAFTEDELKELELAGENLNNWTKYAGYFFQSAIQKTLH